MQEGRLPCAPNLRFSATPLAGQNCISIAGPQRPFFFHLFSFRQNQHVGKVVRNKIVWKVI